MIGLQLTMVVVHSLICLVIIAMAMDLMRKRRNDGHPPDILIWSYYLGAVGACLYLVEPLRGHTPTWADLIFELAVAFYLWARMTGPPPPDLRRKK